jgi:deoxyribodipyrimidine photo-lyase
VFAKSGIFEYKEKRDFPAYPGTSLLSPALKFGVIGIRKIWAKTEELLGEKGADFDPIPPTPLTKGGERENATTNINIETWQKELAWREFYQQALYWFPELEKGAYRELFKKFPWVNNEKHFLAWCEGKTGYPIVDAAMRQLNETGWMHNRCRMIVASFLTKDLIIDWKWGEKYFMQHLIDGDLASNNGGWQWSASSGMDQQPLRIFNPTTQGQKFDPDGEYMRRWLPELRLVDKEYLISGKIPDYWLRKCGYSGQIVEHNLQQRKFKELYQGQKL